MKEKGFTLMELLVVVAIVGILSSISVAQFQEYKRAAYDAKAKVLQRNLTTAVEGWVNTDWNGNPNGLMYWWGWADGTEQFDGANVGQELKQFMSGSIVEESMRIAVGCNTSCFDYPGTCGSSYRTYAWAGHCQVETVTGIYHRINQYWNMNTGDVLQVKSQATLTQSKCPS